MEVVKCSGHDQQCFLRTGTRQGANQGKSFYVCSHRDPKEKCEFVKPSKLDCKACPHHKGEMIYLQAIHTSSSGEHNCYYRCRGKSSQDGNKSNWCGQFTKPQDKAFPLKTFRLTENTSNSQVTANVNKNKTANNHTSQPNSHTSPSSDNTTSHSTVNTSHSSDTSPSSANSKQNKLPSENLASNTPPQTSSSGPTSSFEALAKSGSTSSDIASPASFKTSDIASQFTSSPMAYRNKAHIAPEVAKSLTVPYNGQTAVLNSDKSDVQGESKENMSVKPNNYKDKEAVDVIEVISSDDESDTQDLNLNLDEARKQRRDLQLQLDKQKTVVRSVKMSLLPDKGRKLMQDIERTTTSMANLHKHIQKLEKNPNLGSTQSKTVYTIQPKPAMANQTGPYTIQPKPAISNQIGPSYTITHPTQSHMGNKVMLQTKPGTNQMVFVNQPTKPGSNQSVMLSQPVQLPAHVLAQMYAANPQAMTLYGGRMTAARMREVTTITKDALERLHKQLECCPSDTDELDDPKGLKVTLMTHQKQALAWLTWRERQNPAGGILADDMGLGKTLTSISLVLKQREVREAGSKEEKSTWMNRDKQLKKLGKSVIKSNATLIICPASLVHQWAKEIERRCKPGLLKVLLYHGPNRERDILRLSDNDIVLTTYNIVSIEVGIVKGESAEDAIKEEEEEKENEEESSSSSRSKQPNILRIAWERIILDEAHNIKNFKSKTSMSVCKLRSGFRWALTGTPIQNDLLDMYALLRFLRCSPFDEYKVWKRNVDNSKGTTRLNTIVRSLLLRRTKQQTDKEGKPLVPLPTKTVKTYKVELTKEERAVYDKFFSKTKSTVQSFVKRHEEKESGNWNSKSKPSLTEEFNDKLRLDDKGSNVSSSSSGSSSGSGSQTDNKVNASQLLVLILRLRQCCCHLSLMKQQLEDDSLECEGINKDSIELTLEQQMQGLLLDSESKEDSEVAKTDFKLMFQQSHFSSKLHAVIEKIKQIRKETQPGDAVKSVIVSQWTKMLDVIGHHLDKLGIRYSTIQGNIAAKKRTELVEDFNTNPDGAEVMLVSLRAGGVGLNLIGGSHLFVVDIHWNPALELQACDRIFRVGQKRDVFIHKYVCKDTIEEKIVDLQKNKTQLATNVLSGAGATSQKLSLADLRMMFGV